MVPNDLPMQYSDIGLGSGAGGLTTPIDQPPGPHGPPEPPMPYNNPYQYDDHLLNATYYSPDVEENLESTALLGNIVHSDSPTHIETAGSVGKLIFAVKIHSSYFFSWHVLLKHGHFEIYGGTQFV